MKTRGLFLLVLLVAGSLLFFCSKDDDGPTGPTTPSGRDVSSFKLFKHYVEGQLPTFVNIMFQVTDLQGVGVEFLDVDRFQVIENGELVDQDSSAMHVRKKDDLLYELKTVLVLDNSEGCDLAALKAGAKGVVNNMFDKQSVAVYTVSDKLELLQDFTLNKSALTSKIDAMTTGAAANNLYGSLFTVFNEYQETYSLKKVEQYIFVVITDSGDDVGEKTLNQVFKSAEIKYIHAIGYGTGVDPELMEAIGTVKYHQVGTGSEVGAKCAEVQEAIDYWAQGFYWLVYASGIRQAGAQEAVVTVKGNQYLGDGSSLSGYYYSDNFHDIEGGVVVNWKSGADAGSEVVYVLLNDTTTVTATSFMGTNAPSYSWEVDKPDLVKLIPDPLGNSVVHLAALGNDGDEVTLTVKDVANNFTKNVKVIITNFRMGLLLQETWNNVSGTSVSNLTSHPDFPGNPHVTAEIEKFEIPSGVGDNYGVRVRGYVHPPVTGEYRFWIASDDASELHLSTDSSPDNAEVVCNVSSWTNSREWGKETNQKSDWINLEAGKHYYIEALMKEGTGGDNLAVAWEGPGITRTVLADNWISIYMGD